MPIRRSSPAPELFAHQPPPRADGKLPIIITHLELQPANWTRRGRPPDIALSITHVQAPDTAFYRELYDRIGRPWLWYERRLMSDEALAALLARPGHEVHVARHGETIVGFFELDGETLDFFGLALEFIGRRIGPWLLDRAIERGLAGGAPRLHLNTNTVDHPRALDTYCKAGFRIVYRERRELEDPRVLWPQLYRWPPQ